MNRPSVKTLVICFVAALAFSGCIAPEEEGFEDEFADQLTDEDLGTDDQEASKWNGGSCSQCLSLLYHLECRGDAECCAFSIARESVPGSYMVFDSAYDASYTCGTDTVSQVTKSCGGESATAYYCDANGDWM